MAGDQAGSDLFQSPDAQGAAERVRRPCQDHGENNMLFITHSWAWAIMYRPSLVMRRIGDPRIHNLEEGGSSVHPGRPEVDPCMSLRAAKSGTTSHGCLPRMGPQNSSEEGTHGGLPRGGPHCGIAPHQNAHGAATPYAAHPDRPFDPWDLDPVEELGCRLRFWSNLEPLIERI